MNLLAWRFREIICKIGRLYILWTCIYLVFTDVDFIRRINNVPGIFKCFLIDGTVEHLWFLPALILGMICANIIVRYVKNRNHILTIGLLIAAIGIIFSTYLPVVKMIFGADNAALMQRVLTPFGTRNFCIMLYPIC